jgi:hypothetical protein
MKPAVRSVAILFVAVLALSCRLDQASTPLSDPAFDRQIPGENPDCQAASRGIGQTKHNPVGFLCAIEIPGNPITSSAKGWVDEQSGLYFLSDASNSGVDVIDIATHKWIARIGGFAGAAATGGGTATTNGPGPSSFVTTQRGELWVSDGNSTVRVVDIDNLQVIASISTAIPACDGGTATTHYCGRTNEINYDPEHKIILVSNPNPLTLTTPHVMGDPYATFISAVPPYEVLGHVTFPGAGNAEGHVWVPELQRFLLPVQPTAATQATRGTMYIAVINPTTMEIEDRRIYYCPEIPGTTPTSTGNNNLQLARAHNLWGQICGRPIRMDVRTGHILNVITQVGTGDQDWYNPGDDNFYVTGTDAATGVASLGVMDASRGVWLQNVPHVLGASPSAYARTNEIFTRVQVNAAIVAGTAPDDSRCVVKRRGCVVVFHHSADTPR